MTPHLTDRQRKLLAYILDYIHKQGHPPTIREIGRAFGFRSTGTVRDHLRALQAKGCLQTQPGKARSLRPSQWLRALPVLGRVPAGGPVLAEENVEATVDLAREFGGEQIFALKVHGDSMIEAGIQEGDLVVVRTQSDAAPNQIVVALVSGEATVKTLVRRGAKWWLQPANPRYKTIPVTEDTRICGRVIGVLRSYERRF